MLSLQAEAQRPNTRKGFWLSFAFGVGSHSQGAASADEGRQTDPVGNLRLGGTVSQKVLLGGDASVWPQLGNGDSISVGFVGPTILFYPSATGSFYVKGSISFTAFSNAEKDISSSLGPALSVEVGNDFRVARNFSLVVFLNAIAATDVELRVNGNPTGIDVTPNLVQVGLGVGWH